MISESLDTNDRQTAIENDESRFELAAESITVRIRWFGLCVGYALVYFSAPMENRVALYGILLLGAAYAIVDTSFSLRNRVFLGGWPLVISLMEAVFIGLLCHFDFGLESQFRYYYFLSLLVCALRYQPRVTYTTFLMHAASFSALAISRQTHTAGDLGTVVLTVVLMGWVTSASTALANLMRSVRLRLSQLNDELQRNQRLLEHRIDERTQELQASQALLLQQEKQAAFGLLAAGIAHEVGNPLAAISSLVQLLNRREQDEYTRERLVMVDEQLRRIQRTLRELVDFSRPATNEETDCDIHEVIDEALNIAKYYKRKKGKTIVTEYSADLPEIRAVRDQLVQVFLNLIQNAMDATDEGGVIRIFTDLEDEELYVLIEDDGHGISRDDRDKLFKAYFTTKESGTGLGLFVCRNIVEQTAGGRITLADSSEGHTTFRVSLPVDPTVA